ncbi:unnamed protein product [Chilo suppressalis]|uniref:Cuticle protein n=1 Tax=Chilo suppressalis TaxID=168631 RepID=A0ABN8B742_CHISP|nr:unnamed protein product [Chilo suppressalis]
MRVLIVAAVLACAAAAPSGALLGHHGLGYAAAPIGLAHGSLAVAHAAPYAVAHAAPLAVAHAAPALPTISPGDIHGAQIDAHVDASDHARAAVDAAREAHDQHSELAGQAVNAAEDHSWQSLDAVKTHEAQLDGAAAGVAPVLAKQLAGHVAYAAPAVHAYAAAPVAHGYAGAVAHGYAAPAVHGYAAPAVAAYAAPASKTVVTQSLSQSHPAPVVHAPVIAHAAPHAYAHGLSHGW